jgi:hypothetical protein
MMVRQPEQRGRAPKAGPSFASSIPEMKIEHSTSRIGWVELDRAAELDRALLNSLLSCALADFKRKFGGKARRRNCSL